MFCISPRGLLYDPHGQVRNETRPIAGVRRAGMAQLEQVQHASVTWLVQWQTHTQNLAIMEPKHPKTALVVGTNAVTSLFPYL